MQPGAAPEDVPFEALAHPRRRVLEVIQQREPPVALLELAQATRSGADTPTTTSGDRLEIGLPREHLPMLAETGIIEYDPSRRSVTRVVRGVTPSESSPTSPDEATTLRPEGERVNCRWN